MQLQTSGDYLNQLVFSKGLATFPPLKVSLFFLSRSVDCY